MPEKTRAFLALSGQVYPRVGDRAVFSEGLLGDTEFSDDWLRTVEVMRVSATGSTIWTRFVHPEGQRCFGIGLSLHRWRLQRRWLGHYDGSGMNAPAGVLIFR